ncbi:MAG TPA: hypothetical protein VGJ21_02260 [Terracidiphilus sp.]|jgi:cell division protein FtsI/penicillin-binding protein 2
MNARAMSMLLAFAICAASHIASAQDETLFAQTASATLERQFGRSELAWILLNNSGQILALHWDSPEAPIAPGSLVKPFLAQAYGEQHDFLYPRVFCAGTKSACWRPGGHGWLGIESALGESCNAYFLSLADGIDHVGAAQTFAHFGLRGPPVDAPNRALIGLGREWEETPLALARAYLALLRETGKGKEVVADGMAIAAERGTAGTVNSILGHNAAFAKTGTAVCAHSPRAAADGFAVVIYPAPQTRLLLMVRMHGATGAQTAAVAGQMMHSIGQGVR